MSSHDEEVTGGEAAGAGPSARAFADLAEDLHRAGGLDDVLPRVTQAAVALVDGCDHASVTLSDGRRAWTPAATSPFAERADGEQYATGEGPCLAALDDVLVRHDPTDWSRWPSLRERWEPLGPIEVMSCGLRPRSAAREVRAALNLYARGPGEFSPASEQVARIMAVHAGVAVAAAQERDAARDLEEALSTALVSRDVIGQAKGVLIARMGISPDEAFDVLRRASQRLNVKLRQVAQDLVASAARGDDPPHL